MVRITTHEGRTFANPLKLSEAHLLSKIAQENKSALVTCEEMTEADFKTTFG